MKCVEEGSAGAYLCNDGESDVLEDFAARGAAEADDGQQAAQVIAEKRHVSRLHRYRRACTKRFAF